MLPVSRFARDINAIFANYLPSSPFPSFLILLIPSLICKLAHASRQQANEGANANGGWSLLWRQKRRNKREEKWIMTRCCCRVESLKSLPLGGYHIYITSSQQGERGSKNTPNNVLTAGSQNIQNLHSNKQSLNFVNKEEPQIVVSIIYGRPLKAHWLTPASPPLRTSLRVSVLISPLSSSSYHYFRGGLFLSLMSFAPFCSVIQKEEAAAAWNNEKEKIIN